jgi:hypothetical protein
VPVGDITPQHLAAYATADANGFGPGSMLYRAGMGTGQGQSPRHSYNAWREITAPA